VAVPAVTSASWRYNNNNNNGDLYGFERYSGLSGWRTNRTTSEIHGDMTMEATAWKKRAQPRGDVEEDDDVSMDEDDLDKGKRSKRGAGNQNAVATNMGAEAQLVRMHQKAEDEMLGRSWGRSNRVAQPQDKRFVYNQTSGNSSLPKLGEDSLVVTVADGTTVNVKLSKNHYFTAKHQEDSSIQNSGGQECLLGMPMAEIVRRADILQKRVIKRKLEREERKSKRSKAAGVAEEIKQDAIEQSESAEAEEGKSDKVDEDEQTTQHDQSKAQNDRSDQQKQHRREMQLKQRLWVDKHAPTSISHLLSDERTNREVLRALRLWDPYVFKRDAPARPVPAYASFRSQQQQGGEMGKRDGKWNAKKKEGEENGTNGESHKTDVRPDESSRVILLSGPPGVGKSTLAHIVCRHAGYRPIEVNASDERSASALTERVTRAMESSTLILGDEEGNGKSGRPNCIILDEVDGADAKTSIAAIVDIVRAEIPPPSKAGSSKAKKGGRRTTYLRRPIILICNRKHAPALRPILPYARQFDVQPPNPERLTARLRAVLAAENMSVVAGGMLLHRLVASTGGDVRSCLYALQFASARAKELDARKRERESGGAPIGSGAGSSVVDISSTLMAALGDTGNGMKDMQSDISHTVATVFRKDKSRSSNKRQKVANGKAITSSEQKGVNLVLKAVDHFGDNSKTLDCLYMNVNRVAYVDPTLDRCSVAFEWLSGADIYRSHKTSVAMNNNAEHQSMQKYYMPCAAAAIHLLCCIETRPDLTFSSRELSDLHYQNQTNVSLVQRFVEGLSPRTRSGIGGGTDVVVSDVIPYSLWLLSAGNGKHSLSKPVSSLDILSSEEKLAFSAHVATLRALGLTYIRDDRGFHNFNASNATTENVRLEPEIDKLVKFEHLAEGFSVERKQVPPVLKELLAHGATVAALRERESEARIVFNTSELKVDSLKEKPQKLIIHKESGTKAEKRKVVRNFLNIGAAKAKEAETARRAARVGFDRSKKVKLSNTGSGLELTKVIRFKFQKGFTQAVRAPCQIEDLM
ncbi:hypothetical protein HJC23_001176, partial [Cyclotella cryptica]